MSQPTEQRPPQVTLASAIVMFSSVLVLLTAAERVSTLGSLDTQEAVRGFLAEAPFASLGLDVEGATALLRVFCIVAAVAACGTAILGWYVRRPDRSARLGLTLFAVPLFVAAMPTGGGLAGSFVAAGAAMLWIKPAGEWFATGRWTPPAPPPERDAPRRTPLGGRRAADRSVSPGATPTSTTSATSATPTAPTPPPATRPYGEPQDPHAGSHLAQPTLPTPQQRQPLLDARPGAMVAAFVITVVTAGGLLALSLLWVAIAGLSPDFLRSVVEQQQPDLVDDGAGFGRLRTAVLVLASVLIVWSSVALLLAGFAMARRAWARRGLLVSAAFSAGVCFALVLSTPLVLLPAAAAVATVVCLRRVEVRQWFALDGH